MVVVVVIDIVFVFYCIYMPEDKAFFWCQGHCLYIDSSLHNFTITLEYFINITIKKCFALNLNINTLPTPWWSTYRDIVLLLADVIAYVNYCL